MALKAYTVKDGDRITFIARDSGTTPDRIVQLNAALLANRPLSAENLPVIRRGDVLTIPAADDAPAADESTESHGLALAALFGAIIFFALRKGRGKRK